MNQIKVFAFYLPQFHPIPENNEWWGEGFTEWRNVALSRPRFIGHDQPRVPSDLGFYDLRMPETHKQQANLARKHGVDGFCYYHYWFNGKTLLEEPVKIVLNDKSIDISFIMCWANENWTRRWDGKDQQVLIAQDYAEYDPKAHFEHMLQFFLDDRYEKYDNKPIFVIYRANQMVNLSDMIEIWDELARMSGFEGMYFMSVSTSDRQDSRALSLGIRRIIDFQPSKNHPTKGINLEFFSYVVSGAMKGDLKIVVTKVFGGIEFAKVFNYKKIARRKIAEKISLPYLPCIMPQWDNSARRRTDSTVIQNGDVNLYGEWLKSAIESLHCVQGPKYIFINAWNEWAEGCYLEPDVKNGSAFLDETKRRIDESVK